MPAPPSVRSGVLLAALSDEPTTTSDVYERVGYLNLMRAELIQYERFRAALVELVAAGLAQSELTEEGTTLWRLPAPADGPQPPEPRPGAGPGS